MALLSGIWGNSNYDSEKEDPRGQFIQSVQDSVDEKIATIYGMAPENTDETEINPDDPFWSAMYRGLEKIHGTAKPTKDEIERAIAESESEFKLDIDQIEDS